MGVLNTGIHLGVVMLVLAHTPWHQMGANALAYCVASSFSYLLNARWSFGATHHWRGFLRFQGVTVLGFVASALLGYMGDLLAWHYLFTVFLVALIVPALSFSLHRTYTFGKAAPDPDPGPGHQPDCLGRFPKTRPPLPESYRAIHEREYIANRTQGGVANRIARFLESWMHRQVAATAPKTPHTILELGAGSLNHLPWERGYQRYDVVEPFRALHASSPHRALVHQIYADLSEVPPDQRYDRIISTAVLEHLTDLPAQLACAALHLKEGGVFCAGIPSEGAWLWRMAWQYGTGPAFRRRTGLDYAVLMHHEHVNTAQEIEACIRHFFSDVTVKRFPTPFKTLSLYTFIEARGPVSMGVNEAMGTDPKTGTDPILGSVPVLGSVPIDILR